MPIRASIGGLSIGALSIGAVGAGCTAGVLTMRTALLGEMNVNASMVTMAVGMAYMMAVMQLMT